MYRVVINRTIFLSSRGIIRKFDIRKKRIGKRNTISDPSKTAKPTSQINMPRYIGLRLNPNGPDVTRVNDPSRNLKLVPSFRNNIAVQVINPNPSNINTAPRYEYG